MQRSKTASLRTRSLAGMLAATAAIGAALTAIPALAQDQDKTAATPTTGSHIDPKARAQMMDPIIVGGATEAGRAVPLDASEKQAAERPAIGEVDAAQWLADDSTPNP